MKKRPSSAGRVAEEEGLKKGKIEIARIRLREWEEVRGTLNGFKKDDFGVSVIINKFQVEFNTDSTEAKIVGERINEGLIGERIALLQTDDPKKPLRVKIERRKEDPLHPSLITTYDTGDEKILENEEEVDAATASASVGIEHPPRDKAGGAR